jgi:hypothetical protein
VVAENLWKVRRVEWRLVDTLDDRSVLHGLDLDVGAGASGGRFESDAGGHALLLPVGRVMAGTDAGVMIAGCAEEVSDVLVLDPPDPAGAVSLLAFLGRRASTVRAALPRDTVAAGLIADAGRVTVPLGSDPPAEYGLFRVEDRTRLAPRRAADDGKLGEGEDALSGRAEWFQGREGGSG